MSKYNADLELLSINNRIMLLKSRGETMNGPIIRKLERRKRVLLANG